MTMKVYGYTRVSTKKQSEEMQTKAIHAFSRIDMMYSETFTGTTINRTQFNKLVKQVDDDIKNGEQVTIIFYSVSRMSRNAAEGIEQYFSWYDKGVELVFLNERYIDTSVFKAAMEKQIATVSKTGDKATDKFIGAIVSALEDYQKDLAIKQIELAFAQSEKEVQDLHQRTKDGMRESGAADKIRQARKGKTYTTAKELDTRISMLECLKDFGGQQNLKRFAEDKGLSRTTVYKYFTAIQEDLKTMSKEQVIKKYRSELKAKQK